MSEIKFGKFGQILLVIIKFLCKIFFPYEVRGLSNIPNDQNFILISNHISMIDPVFLLIAQKNKIYFMGKEELFRKKFLGYLLKKQFGCFPVERGKGDMHALDIAYSVINSNCIMGIFPEGTRSRTGQLLRFKSGAALIAAKTKASVLPVYISSKNQKVKLFQKTIISFGKLISQEELGLIGEKPNLRHATRVMQSSIQNLMENSI